jgi:hypothetical protein
LLPLCYEDLEAITLFFSYQNPGEKCRHIFYPGDHILFEQREVRGLLSDPENLKDYIKTGQNTADTLIHYWSVTISNI